MSSLYQVANLHSIDSKADPCRKFPSKTTRQLKVLLPTHRSYYDFIIISWVFYRLPELNFLSHAIPAMNTRRILWNWNFLSKTSDQKSLHIAAASDAFSNPFLRWVMKKLGAFFIRRNSELEKDSRDISYKNDLTPEERYLELDLELNNILSWSKLLQYDLLGGA